MPAAISAASFPVRFDVMPEKEYYSLLESLLQARTPLFCTGGMSRDDSPFTYVPRAACTTTSTPFHYHYRHRHAAYVRLLVSSSARRATDAHNRPPHGCGVASSGSEGACVGGEEDPAQRQEGAGRGEGGLTNLGGRRAMPLSDA